jgi:asparagine synthase (glutamine-hydrolysing)
MCGISGIINQNNQVVSFDKIKKINDLIAHRGPDDEGFFLENNIAFGHRRLAILDLSLDGHQPMHYRDKYVIVFNGEIYNYLEIRGELLECGYVFKSTTDTEVILASYDKWGEDCVNHFNGMWAFALYDKRKKIIFCSRDRFGVKPFYYTQKDHLFVFGSEIKQLLVFYTDKYVNKTIMMDYLVIGHENHTQETFFENIYQLLPSHNLIYNLFEHKCSINRYYKINRYANDFNEIETIDLYRKYLFDSVKLRLRSDVTVGSCLSGGLDSSAISAIASNINKKMTNNKFVVIHAKSIEKKNDESSYAKKVADFCNLDLHVVTPITEDFVKLIDEVIYTQEEPFGGPSVFMQYFVMEKAKELGCTVMLDGQGGDETLLGYERYYPAFLMAIDFFSKIKYYFYAVNNSKITLSQLFKYLIYFTNVNNTRIKKLLTKSYYLKRKYLEMINSDILKINSKNYFDVFLLQCNEIYSTQMPHLLRYEDRNSMRHSIETRLPFIDYRLLENALNMNNLYKMKGGWTKYILRKAINDILPDDVIWRKNKFGFEAPVKTWLDNVKNELQKTIEYSNILSEIKNRSIEVDQLDNRQKWRLFNIARWEKIYNVQID